MKLFLLLIPFLCISDINKKCAKKKAPVEETVAKSTYQFPSVLIISFN